MVLYILYIVKQCSLVPLMAITSQTQLCPVNTHLPYCVMSAVTGYFGRVPNPDLRGQERLC